MRLAGQAEHASLSQYPPKIVIGAVEQLAGGVQIVVKGATVWMGSRGAIVLVGWGARVMPG
jgi:hypothetical protein